MLCSLSKASIWQQSVRDIRQNSNGTCYGMGSGQCVHLYLFFEGCYKSQLHGIGKNDLLEWCQWQLHTFLWFLCDCKIWGRICVSSMTTTTKINLFAKFKNLKSCLFHQVQTAIKANGILTESADQMIQARNKEHAYPKCNVNQTQQWLVETELTMTTDQIH